MFDLKFTYASNHVKMQLNTLYSTFMLMWILFLSLFSEFYMFEERILFYLPSFMCLLSSFPATNLRLDTSTKSCSVGLGTCCKS